MILEETMLLVQLDDCDGTAVKDYFAEMLANGDEEKPYSGFSYTFCYIRESDGKVIGMLNLRPEEDLAKMNITGTLKGNGSVGEKAFDCPENENIRIENIDIIGNSSDAVLAEAVNGCPEKSETVKDTEKREGSADFIGTIGYSVRPTERGKGYGTALLEQGLELCEMFGITPVAVVKKDNAASIRALEKNGFVLSVNEQISEIYDFFVKSERDR